LDVGALDAQLLAMPRMPRVVVAALTFASATVAHADCPTNTRDLPPVGFLADATRLVTGGALADLPAETSPRLVAHAGAAGGVLADRGDVKGTGSLGGDVAVRRGSFSGCASGDLLDVREGAAHGTASAQFPFFFTGLSFGTAIDRNVRLPLATRAELFRAPVSRIAVQFSMAFLDFEMTDKQNKLRTQVMPVSMEQELTSQDDGVVLDRRISTVEVAMFRFVASAPGASSQLSVFDFDFQEIFLGPPTPSNDPSAVPIADAGFARIAPLKISSEGERWSWELDGGWLSLGGFADCDVVRCSRGYYLGSLRHAWRHIAVEGRAERSAFIATNDLPAFEDRATVSTTVQDDKRSASGAAFVARTEAWESGEHGTSAGVRVSLSHQLKSGLAALVDGELVRVNGKVPTAATQPLTGDAARLLVSVAWKKSLIRY
jgi:hypothetical protein